LHRELLVVPVVCPWVRQAHPRPFVGVAAASPTIRSSASPESNDPGGSVL
jgi:hypothetical protein